MPWEQTAVLVACCRRWWDTPGHDHVVSTAIRDQQANGMGELAADPDHGGLDPRVGPFDRRLRTRVHHQGGVGPRVDVRRQRLERLTELATRIQVELENGNGVAAEIGRMAAAMTDVAGACRQMTGTGLSLTAGRAARGIERCFPRGRKR